MLSDWKGHNNLEEAIRACDLQAGANATKGIRFVVMEDNDRYDHAFLALTAQEAEEWLNDPDRPEDSDGGFIHYQSMSDAEESFFNAYVECALWSDTDGEQPLDDNYGPDDIDPDCLREMRADCISFQEDNAALLESAYTEETVFAYDTDNYQSPSDYLEANAGNDFWLTRNHHGAGFWDRGLGSIGDKLTEAAQAYGETYVEIKQEARERVAANEANNP